MKISGVETAPPILRKLPKGDNWEYAAEWVCSVTLKGEGVLVVRIRPGYWTDLASVPKALRGAFDNGSGEFRVLVASQLHDMLYSTHYMSKDFSDALFHAVLRHYGMGSVKAWLYYQAVHLFGDKAWETISDAEMEADRRLCSFQWLARV